jgi:DUF4097 and DUF4098 domain-containing protein YvlB
VRRVLACSLLSLVAAAPLAVAAPGEEMTARSTVPVEERVTRLVTDLEAGSLTVRPGAKPVVEITKTWETGAEPEVEVTEEDGVLTVTSRCPFLVDGPLVYVGGVSNCTVDVAVTLPRGALDTALSLTSGPLVLSSFRGAHRLSTGTGSVTVSGTSGASLLIDASSADVSLRDVRTDRLEVRTGTGDATVTSTQARGRALVDTSSGTLSLEALTADALTVESGTGDVVLRSSRSKGRVDLATSSGALEVESLSAARLSIDTGTGPVSLSRSTLLGDLVVESSSGAVQVQTTTASTASFESGTAVVTLDALRARSIAVDSSSGRVDVRRSHASTYDVRTGSAPVVVDTSVAPRDLAVETSSGDIDVTVPRGAYSLLVDSSTDDDIEVDGVTDSPSAERRLDLRTSSGSITVRGR